MKKILKILNNSYQYIVKHFYQHFLKFRQRLYLQFLGVIFWIFSKNYIIIFYNNFINIYKIVYTILYWYRLIFVWNYFLISSLFITRNLVNQFRLKFNLHQGKSSFPKHLLQKHFRIRKKSEKIMNTSLVSNEVACASENT